MGPGLPGGWPELYQTVRQPGGYARAGHLGPAGSRCRFVPDASASLSKARMACLSWAKTLLAEKLKKQEAIDKRLGALERCTQPFSFPDEPTPPRWPCCLWTVWRCCGVGDRSYLSQAACIIRGHSHPTVPGRRLFMRRPSGRGWLGWLVPFAMQVSPRAALYSQISAPHSRRSSSIRSLMNIASA